MYLQIQSLQHRAMSGELITMDLVKDLQTRLVQVENQVTNQEKPGPLQKSYGKTPPINVPGASLGKDDTSTRLNLHVDLSRSNMEESNISRSNQGEDITLFDDSVSVNLHSDESEEDAEDVFSMMKEPMKKRNTYEGRSNAGSSVVSMSMSKRELLTEIKKEKAQHRKQIRYVVLENETLT